MAFDEGLAHRIREMMADRPGITEKRMFGGLCFLVDGKMLGGIIGDDLMARVGPVNYAAAMAKPHVRAMDFTGRPLKGFVYVDSAGIESDAELWEWLDAGYQFALTAKPSKPSRKRTE